MRFLCTTDALVQVNDPVELDKMGNKVCIINLRSKRGEVYECAYDLTKYAPESFRSLDRVGNLEPNMELDPEFIEAPGNPSDEVMVVGKRNMAARRGAPTDEVMIEKAGDGPSRRVLLQLAKERGITGADRMTKPQLEQVLK